MTEMVETDLRDGIATVAINNPAKRNCLNAAGAERFGEAVLEAAAVDAVKVIVLRGAGGKAFSAGADLSSVVDSDDVIQAVLEMAGAIDRMTGMIAAVVKPVIAGIDGICLGGGLQIAAAADIRVASVSATLGIPAIRRGFIASPAGIARLVRLLGVGSTKLLLLEGGTWNGEVALAKGLVDVLVPKEDFEQRLEAFAKSLAGLDDAALAASKQIVDGVCPVSAIPPELQTLHDQVNSNEQIRQTLMEFSKRKT